MFIAIEPDTYKAHQNLIMQMHRMRKAIFHDRLHWNVSIEGDFEIDLYDARSVYILWCDDRMETLIGCIRLLPTTGPTLLDAVFRSTYPSNVTLSAPSIWEATRACVDDRSLAVHHPELSAAAAFGRIMLAVCEWSLAHYVDTIVANYEPRVARIYRRAGIMVEELGRADGYGRFPVCCGLIEISTALRATMRLALGVDKPLLGVDGIAMQREVAP